MNPFDLTGPAFLTLFIIVAFAGLMLALLIRHRYRATGDGRYEEPDLHPYEIAHLAGGATLTVNTALAHLVENGQLTFDHATGKLAIGKRSSTIKEHPLDRALLEIGTPEFEVKEAREAAAGPIGEIRQRLEHLGLEMPADRAWEARWRSGLIMFVVAGFGAIKIAVGLSRHRPVAFLVIGCLVCLVFAAILLSRRIVRTLRGDAYLEKLRQRHAALQTTGAKAPSTLQGRDLMLAVGLFGMGVLVAGPLAGLHQAIQAQMGAGNNAWSDTGGGCGGGGCGGGSGCGGGGCGGGGCGGCGGGD